MWIKIYKTKKSTLPPPGRWIMGTQVGWPGPIAVEIKKHHWSEHYQYWLFSARNIGEEPVHITYWREIEDIDLPVPEQGDA